MTTPSEPPPEDGAADTQMFRAFVERDDSVEVKPVGAPFRIITLVAGLVIFAALIFLLFKL